MQGHLQIDAAYLYTLIVLIALIAANTKVRTGESNYEKNRQQKKVGAKHVCKGGVCV